MALIMVVIQDTDEGPTVSIVTEPHLSTGPDQAHTPAQQIAINMVNQLNAQTRAESPQPAPAPEASRILPADAPFQHF